MTNSLAADSRLFAKRLLLRWRREPVMPIQALLYPTFLLISYYLLVGRSTLKSNVREKRYLLQLPIPVLECLRNTVSGSSNGLYKYLEWQVAVVGPG